MRDFRRKDAGLKWLAYDTLLSDYHCIPRFHFGAFLLQKIADAKLAGSKLRVLDVGIGSGKQWADFLQEPGLELHGSSLTRSAISGISKRVRICRAANLHRNFKPSSFDMVITHMGMHEQELDGVENAIWLLKPGGEAIISGERNRLNFLEVLKSSKQFYEVVASSNRKGIWSVHLRKK